MCLIFLPHCWSNHWTTSSAVISRVSILRTSFSLWNFYFPRLGGMPFGGDISPFMVCWCESPLHALVLSDTFRVTWKSVGAVVKQLTRSQWKKQRKHVGNYKLCRELNSSRGTTISNTWVCLPTVQMRWRCRMRCRIRVETAQVTAQVLCSQVSFHHHRFTHLDFITTFQALQ